MSLEVQFLTLGAMFACGFAIAVLFDTYRVLAGQLRMPRWLIPPFDLAYWALATALVFRMLYLSNKGELRFFVFIGLAFGLAFHFLFTSGAAILTVIWAINCVKACLRFVKRAFHAAVVVPLKALYRIFAYLLGIVAALSIFLIKIVLQLLYPLGILLRWLFRPLVRRLKWPQWAAGPARRLSGWFRKWFSR